ncbi:MAG TPA: ATP-binding protein [Gemmatimonadaceae bacterium]
MPPLERQVLDALPFTVYTVDLDGRITYMNHSTARAAQSNGAPPLGDEEAVIGVPVWNAIAGDATREQIEQAMATVREGRAPSVAWEFPRGAPAEERMFLMQVSAIGEGRAVTGFTVSTVDITPSHRWREALIDTGMALAHTMSADRVFHEVAQQLRRALACDAVAIALSDGEPDVLRVVHQSGFAIAPDQIAAHFAPAWDEALRGRRVVTRASEEGTELTAPMMSGEGVFGAITLTSSPIPAHRLEESRRVLETIAAETAATVERVRTVQRLGDRRRLEAIGEVTTGVAHELRNPLFGISSAAQLLRFRVREDPVVEKNVGRILREVERLNSMVTSLLEYGRPGPITLAPGDPDAVWDEVLENQRGLLESRAVLLERSRAPSARCSIDSQQLAHVFANLLVNATDAAPEGSDLTLTSSVLANGQWRCRLHNGGPPIPPDALPRVFEIFFSTKPGGSGIGLALCKRIVEEHGGSVSLESTPENGTSATVLLPLATA